ncbi:MAG: PilZ domain-containing protein [Candidatus Eremiobacterota bacterium]
MFSFLNKPQQAELLEVHDRLVTIRTARENAPGRTIKVRLTLPGLPETEAEKMVIPVTVASCRPGAAGGFLCIGAVPSAEGLERFREILDRQRAAEPGLRRSQRYQISIRILSPELPNFRALSVDLSRHGLQLEAEGEVEPGTLLTLTLELDHPQAGSTLLCQGRVVWCRWHSKAKARVGVEFVELDPAIRHDLERFERVLRSRMQQAS